MIEVISLGGGIQSTTLVLMNLLGEIKPRAQCVVFADTQWERRVTYSDLDRLTHFAVGHDFPIYRVMAGNIKKDMLQNSAKHYDHIPFYTDTGKERAGQLRRQCTAHYKIAPIRRKMRQLFGFRQFSLWIGFSVDEIARVALSRVKYITHRFPLLEQRMRRSDCVAWLKHHGFPIPERSACVCCPYRRNSEWERMKLRSPAEFEAACQFDEAIRDRHLHKARRKDFELYLHESLQPLREIQFENPDQLTLFGEQEECAGGCFL